MMNRVFLTGSLSLFVVLAAAVPWQLSAETKETPKVAWQVQGQYFENCNCDVPCPCVISPDPQMSGPPSAGTCHLISVFHVDHGKYGNVTLDGLNAVVMLDSPPGPMANGNWSVAAYVDARGDEKQRAGLLAVFTGAAGGPMDFGPLVSKVLGVKYLPITFAMGNMARSAEIPGVMHVGVHAIAALAAGKEIWATNFDFIAPDGAVLAVGDVGNTFVDYDRNWQNAGHNGFYAPIKWSSR